MPRKYRWGIIGAGHIARKFATDLHVLPNAVLHAVGSRCHERAEVFAREHRLKKVYGSYEELVADPEIDIVYIATLNTGHYHDTLLCLENGKSVLCEKPAAMNVRQLERMISLAGKNRLFFMEALWTRFVPSFIKCLDLVASGAIGDIRIIKADFCINPPYSFESRLFNPRMGGGALLDIGIYPVFCALEMGSAVTDIAAQASLDKNGIDTVCAILMSHQKGEHSVLFCSSTANGQIEAVVHGSSGMIRLKKCWHVPTIVELIADGKKPVEYAVDSVGYGYHYEAAEVMRCLDAGFVESPLWTWNKSLTLSSTLDKIRHLAGIHYPEHSVTI